MMERKNMKLVAENLNEHINEQGVLNESLVKTVKELDKDSKGYEDKVRKLTRKAIAGRTVGEQTINLAKNYIAKADPSKLHKTLDKAAEDKFKGRFYMINGELVYKHSSKVKLQSQSPAGPAGPTGMASGATSGK